MKWRSNWKARADRRLEKTRELEKWHYAYIFWPRLIDSTWYWFEWVERQYVPGRYDLNWHWHRAYWRYREPEFPRMAPR